MCCLVVGHIGSFVAVYLYNKTNSPDSLDPSLLWELLIGLEILFVACFAIFLSKINPKYISTFFSLMTSKEFIYVSFHSAPSDEARFRVFKYQPLFYESMKGELREWLSDNWDRWTIDEKPAWFTRKLLAIIPEDLLPVDQLLEETRALRRNTLIEMGAEEDGEGKKISTMALSARRLSRQLGLQEASAKPVQVKKL